MSKRISSAYGTHDFGRTDSRPVVGGVYGAGGGESVTVAVVDVADAGFDTTAVVCIRARAGGPDIRTVDALTGRPDLDFVQLEGPVESLATTILLVLDGIDPETKRLEDWHPGCSDRMPRKHNDLMVKAEHAVSR